MGTGGDQFLDVFEGVDASTGAYSGAVESGGGAGEFELLAEGPVLQESVDKASVEYVARPGGVHNGDTEGWDVEEAYAVESEDAFFTECGGGEFGIVTGVHFAEGLLKVGLGGEASWKVAADDEVVDVGEEGFDVGIEFVEVGDHRNTRFAGPGCALNGSFGVVTVDMKSAGVGNPFATEVGGVEDDALVAAAEYGALAVGVDEDEGLRAGNAGGGDDVGLDSGVREGFPMECGGEIVAEFADVASTESPLLAGDDSGGDLSTGECGDGRVFGFGPTGRIGFEGDDRVGSVETYADEVNLEGVRHVLTVL